MSSTIELDIVSAEASIFNGKVTFVSVTGAVGELGIQPGHSPLLTSLKPGQIRATLADGTVEVFYMSGGMLEVQPNMVSILADTAVRAEDLDEAAVIAAKQRAEKIVQQKVEGIEYSKALSELAEAAAQLHAITTLREKLKKMHEPCQAGLVPFFTAQTRPGRKRQEARLACASNWRFHGTEYCYSCRREGKTYGITDSKGDAFVRWRIDVRARCENRAIT